MLRLIAPLLILLILPRADGTSADHSPVATFSIVARDPATGELGVAVQSKIVGVGAVVPFARAGVGAVATQAWANVRYGPIALAALESGVTPVEILNQFVEADPQSPLRQFAILDATSTDSMIVNFTGAECLEWAGGIVGDHYAVQGNILTGPEVVSAMAKAFETSNGPLAERLIASLRAGQAAGGDSRGRQSAGLLIVREGWGYGGGNDRFRDIRVDEHETPIEELDRVYRAHRKLFPRPDQEATE